MHLAWQKKVEKFEGSVRKKQKDIKCRECYEKIFPELRKKREERERLIQKHKEASLQLQQMSSSSTSNAATSPSSLAAATATSDAAAALQAELNSAEEERKRIYDLAVVPPLCFDDKHKRVKFINTNGYVADPVALFKSIKNEVYWNEKEKEIFLEKLLTYGKNFEAIATFLEKKVKLFKISFPIYIFSVNGKLTLFIYLFLLQNVQDCIEYYYLTKKKVNYKLLIRKQQRKRKKEVKTSLNTNSNNNNNNNNSGNGGSGSSGGGSVGGGSNNTNSSTTGQGTGSGQGNGSSTSNNNSGNNTSNNQSSSILSNQLAPSQIKIQGN